MKLYVKAAAIAVAASACGDPGPGSTAQSWEVPDPAFRLGRGYDPDATEQVRGDCLIAPENLAELNWRDARGIQAQLTETRIDSRESLMRELNFSMSASGRYTFYQGEAGFARYEKFTASEDAFTWLFKVDVEMGARTLHTERIDLDGFKPEAAALIRRARNGEAAAKAEFRRMCGKQLVRGVRLGGRIVDVVEISGKALAHLARVQAEISSSAGGALWQASGSATFAQVVKDAARHSLLRRDFSQAGGGRIDYDISPGNVQATLDAFTASMSQGNAVVTAVELIDWESVVNFSPGGVDGTARGFRLAEMLRQLWRHKAKLDRIDSYIHLFEKGDIELTRAEVAELRAKFTEVTAFLDGVMEDGRACYADGAACVAARAPIVVSFPPMRRPALAGTEQTLAHWRFRYAEENTPFDSSQDGDVTLWTTDSSIATTLEGGNPVNVRVEAFEVPCANIRRLLASDGSPLLVSDRGEPLHYLESVWRNPAGVATMVSFGYRHGDDCLRLEFYSDPPESAGFSLADASQAARLTRRMAQSVTWIR